MTRYYKLFDLLNRQNKKKTDLLKIMSSKTLAKLSKGEYVSGEVIDKICIFLRCQPNDIMEVFEVWEIKNEDGTIEENLVKLPSYEMEELEHTLYMHKRASLESYEKIKEQIEKNNQ